MLSSKTRTSQSSLARYSAPPYTLVLSALRSTNQDSVLGHNRCELAGMSSAPEFSRICRRHKPAPSAFRPRMLGIRAASRLARQSARKSPEQGPSGRWRANTKWANLVCQSTVGGGFLTSMNLISSKGDVREYIPLSQSPLHSTRVKI